MMKNLDTVEAGNQKEEASVPTGIQAETSQGEAQQTAKPQPEDNGADGRTFTQTEVNKIIAERLARERSKGEPAVEDTRERELAARESRIKCREYLDSYSMPQDLLDLFNTSDPELFQASLEKMDSVIHGCFGSSFLIGAFGRPAEQLTPQEVTAKKIFEAKYPREEQHPQQESQKEPPTKDGLMRKVFGLH